MQTEPATAPAGIVVSSTQPPLVVQDDLVCPIFRKTVKEADSTYSVHRASRRWLRLLEPDPLTLAY
jgi:hypothetical protein